MAMLASAFQPGRRAMQVAEHEQVAHLDTVKSESGPGTSVPSRNAAF